MSILYRNADVSDIPALIRLRLDYLKTDRGMLSNADEEAVLSQLKKYYPEHLGRDFTAFLAESESNIISAAFLCINERPANISFITGKTGTVLNVFTYPEYRRKGVATEILKRLIETAKRENISYLELSATESGKPLYEKLGFQVRRPARYTDMRLQLI